MNRKQTHLIAFLVLVFVALLVTSAQAQSNSGLLSGNWQGGWNSCSTGHRGRMNAQFCRVDATHVQANFRGTFAKIIPFRYRPVLDIVHEEPGLMVLSGSKKLPLVGNFQYDATVTGNQFHATYRSRRDHGYWTLQR